MNQQSNQKIADWMQTPFSQNVSADELRRRRDHKTDDRVANNGPRPHNEQTEQSPVPNRASPGLIPRTAQQIRGMLTDSFTSEQYTPTNLIENEEDFNLKMHAYLSICNDQDASPNANIDYPADKETQQDLVRDLVSAMIYFG